MAGKRNPSITLCRIASMILILLCHTIRYYTFIPHARRFGEIFNVGVYVFFMLSGYLYGGKEIDRPVSWFIQREKKIYPPVLLYCSAVLVFMSFISPYGQFYQKIPASVVTYLLNLQGIPFIFPNQLAALIPETEGLNHLWFTTIIMLCYLLVPILQILRRNMIFKSKPLCISYLIILLGISFLCSYLFGITLYYFTVFILGYTCGAIDFDKHFSHLSFISLTLVTVLFQLFRLFIRSYGAYVMYSAIVGITHTVLALWVMAFFFEFNHLFPKFCEKLCSFRFITWLDDISFYIYIAHGFFCFSVYNPFFRYKTNIALAALTFTVLTVIVAVILKFLTDLINKAFDALNNKKRKGNKT